MIWKHQQNLDYLINMGARADYVRAVPFSMDRAIFLEERDGFEDGFVELIATLHVDGPGLPPLFPVGVEIDDATPELRGTIYYYGAFEVHRLGHIAFQSQHYHDHETFHTPPPWLGIPEPDDEEESLDEDAGAGSRGVTGERSVHPDGVDGV